MQQLSKSTVLKGFLLNLLYESSYIIFKLLLLNLLLFVVQWQIGVRYIDRLFVNQHDAYISLHQVYQESNLSYLFLIAMMLSLGLIYYLFQKDRIGASKHNAIMTLPFPRYCNFLSKLFCALLCPVSLYATQYLTSILLSQYHTEYHEYLILFRNNDLLLSATERGFFSALYAPNCNLLFNFSILVLLVSSLVCIFSYRAHCLNLKRSIATVVLLVVFGRLMVYYWSEPTLPLCLILSLIFLAFSTVQLYYCYKTI